MMKLIKTFWTEHEALSFISKQKQPRLGDYFISREFGEFKVYLMD